MWKWGRVSAITYIRPGLPFILFSSSTTIVMKMTTNDSGKISLQVFIVSFIFYLVFTYTQSQLTLKKVVNVIWSVLAVLSAAARIMIRFYFQRKLHPDDFILVFACSTFIASQALLYVFKLENIYWLGALARDPMNPQTLALMLGDSEAFYRRVAKVQWIDGSSLALTWTSIYAVKVCFLLFFYELIKRLPRLILTWKIIFGITIFFWAFCISGAFISCPHFGPSSSKSVNFASPPLIMLLLDYKT